MIKVLETGEWINENNWDRFLVEGANDNWSVKAYKHEYEGEVVVLVETGFSLRSLAQHSLDSMMLHKI